MQLHERLVPSEPHAIAMLEAAYRMDRPEDEWVEGIRQAYEPSAPGAPVVLGFLYDASDGNHVRMRSICGGDEHHRTWLAGAGQTEWDPATVSAIFNSPTGSRVSSQVQDEADNRRLFERVLANSMGFVDGWGILGTDLRMRGLLVGAMSRELVPVMSPGLALSWQAASAHLSAAYCLREAMKEGLAPTESVLTPGGRVLDAEGDARSVDARESLRHAVRAIDRARTRHRRQSPEALAAWQAVVAGRWTLVDQTESDGKRVLLARVNALPVRAEARLSEREAQALGLAVQGLSNKQIGYRLGVGAPAVTNYLKRAATKLGVTNRLELVRRAQAAANPYGASG